MAGRWAGAAGRPRRQPPRRRQRPPRRSRRGISPCCPFGCLAIRSSFATSATASSRRSRRGSSSCRISPSSRIATSSRHVSAASIADAARTLGANLIVEGTVQAAGDSLRLVVNLHDIATGKRTWSRQFTGTRETLFTLQDDVYDGLVGALGASPRPESDRALGRSADRRHRGLRPVLEGARRTARRAGQEAARLPRSTSFSRRCARIRVSLSRIPVSRMRA